MPPPDTPPLWLRALSRPAISRAMGSLVRFRPPRPLIGLAIRAFSRAWGVALDEARHPVEHFASFQDFFTRELKDGLRPVAVDPSAVPSPSDGRLSAFGSLDQGRLVQAKGVGYTLDALLGGGGDADPYRGGSYAVIYLAPHNYHRVHTPWDGTLRSWRYLPGALYPVNSIGLRHVPGLFSRNERIVGHFDTEFGRAALIMVGATFVGHMRVVFTDLATNEGRPPSGLVAVEGGRAMARGEEFGVFEMGSTVVMVFERPGLEPVGPLGRPIAMGEPALRVRGAG